MEGGAGRPVRVLTWNVQGSHDLDIAAAADIVRRAGADVVALQEVQRRQARRLADELSMPARRWVLKHWPIVHRAEGLAVLTSHRVVDARPFVLRRAWIWAWRRRVAMDVTVDTDAGIVRVIDVHLSPHDDDGARRREAGIVIARAQLAPQPPIVVGDLNEVPGRGAIGELLAAGWLDAWATVHGEGGATNWTAGDRTGRPPTQRIDYVLVPAGSRVEAAVVIDGVDRATDMAGLSDHLPLVVEVALPGRRRR